MPDPITFDKDGRWTSPEGIQAKLIWGRLTNQYIITLNAPESWHWHHSRAARSFADRSLAQVTTNASRALADMQEERRAEFRSTAETQSHG